MSSLRAVTSPGPKYQDLAEFLAAQLGLPLRTVIAFGTNLKIASELSKTRSGRNSNGGAVMTSRDAAVWLIALLGSSTAIGAVDAVRRIGRCDFCGLFAKEFTQTDYNLVPVALPQGEWHLGGGILLDWITNAIEEIRGGVAPVPAGRFLSISAQNRAPLSGAWIDFVMPRRGGGALAGLIAFGSTENQPVLEQLPTVLFERTTTVGAHILDGLADFLGRVTGEAEQHGGSRGGNAPLPPAA